MAQRPVLFTLPIEPYKSATSQSPGGTLTATQVKPGVYLLSFNSPPDNRLTPPFLQAFILALDIIQYQYPPGIVLTTSAIPKFYSNGLDYAGAIADPSFMTEQLYPLWRKLLAYPLPTVAVINGHNFAGGLMTAMAHDYRIMNPHKGFLCLNELDFNAPLSPAMAQVFKSKLPTTTFRNMILEARRYNALAALEAGIIDGVGGVEEAIAILDESGVVQRTASKKSGESSYGRIKEEMYREVIRDLDRNVMGEKVYAREKDLGRNQREEAGRRRVEEWKAKNSVKAKL